METKDENKSQIVVITELLAFMVAVLLAVGEYVAVLYGTNVVLKLMLIPVIVWMSWLAIAVFRRTILSSYHKVKTRIDVFHLACVILFEVMLLGNSAFLMYLLVVC
jgi:hypothetical protein